MIEKMSGKTAGNLSAIFNSKVDKIITRLGTSNDSEITTATLAAFKLLLIPLSTLSDKKTSKEQKKYALKRDFLTESVALCGYLGITKGIKTFATGPICSKYYKQKAKELVKSGLIDKNSSTYKVLSSVSSKNIKEYAINSLLDNKVESPDMEAFEETIKNLNSSLKDKISNIQLPKNLYFNTKKTISHICVCTLALTLIPFVTNKILELISKNSDNKKPNPKPKSSFSLIQFQKNNNQVSSIYPMTITQYKNLTKSGGYDVLNY